MYLNSGGVAGASYLSENDTKPSIEVLFSKSLMVIVNERGSTINRNINLHITIEMSTNLSTLRKELLIRLTDEFDPFFIYNLNITEEDFQLLKSQQGLLIDFPAFPQKFIDLLELCLNEERKDTAPKFMLNLKTSGLLGCQTANVELEIIETNPFKHLSHLSLKLLPATDAFVRKYLASRLKSFKEDKERLETLLRSSQTEYQSHLHNCQENLSTRNQEFDRVRQSLQNEITSLNRRYAEELRNERENASRIQRESEINAEKLKNNLEDRFKHEIQHLEDKIKRMEAQNSELQEKLKNAEMHTKEIRTHFVNGEDELYQLRQKTATLSKENKSLDLQYHEQLKLMGTLKSQLAAANQEIRDKEQILIKTQELLKTTQEQKKQLEELLDQKQTLVGKRENALRTVSEDLNKGNEIIKKLQLEIRNYHNKLKIHGEVACKQEEAIHEKEKLIDKLMNQIHSYKESLEERETENINLKKEINSVNEKLDQITQQNKSNENVIAWLNKQLNEAGVQRGGFTSTITNPIQNISSIPFRHSAMTSSTPSVPLNMFQTRPSRSPIYSNGIPSLKPDGNIGANSSPKSTEPDIYEPPMATSNGKHGAANNARNQRSSFPPQTRASIGARNKTPSVAINKHK